LHAQVAIKLRQNPGLLNEAAAWVALWQETTAPGNLPALKKWEQLLHSGLEATLAVALSDDPEATELRQSSPLPCLLSPQERWRFLAKWRASFEAR